MTNRSYWETVESKGEALFEQVKAIIAEGNVRRVRVRQGERVIAEFPLTVGVVGALLAPVLAAIGAVVALATDCTIDVERTGPPSTTSVEAPLSDADTPV
jgi:hypothetical protein